LRQRGISLFLLLKSLMQRFLVVPEIELARQSSNVLIRISLHSLWERRPGPPLALSFPALKRHFPVPINGKTEGS
jgi:hypothetical protein